MKHQAEAGAPGVAQGRHPQLSPRRALFDEEKMTATGWCRIQQRCTMSLCHSSTTRASNSRSRCAKCVTRHARLLNVPWLRVQSKRDVSQDPYISWSMVHSTATSKVAERQEILGQCGFHDKIQNIGGGQAAARRFLSSLLSRKG